MKIRNTIAVIALIAAIAHADSFSGVYVFLSQPLGALADSGNFDSQGFAGIGPGLGFQYGLDIGVPNLTVLADASVSYNYLDHERNPMSGVETEGGSYITLPITVGPRVKLPAGLIDAVFSVSGGLNLLWQNEMEVAAFGTTRTVDFETPATTFCWAASAGLELNERFMFGVRYLNMGRLKYDYSYPLLSGISVNGTRRFDASVVQLTAGVQF